METGVKHADSRRDPKYFQLTYAYSNADPQWYDNADTNIPVVQISPLFTTG
jgi:hypothetical protein